jgi:predicted dehydrogenase
VDWQEGQPIPVRGAGTPVEFSSAEPLKEECIHFMECIETRRTPRTDGVNGLRVLQLLHAAQRSLVTNGQPVRVDAPRPRSRKAAPVVETMPAPVAEPT